MNMKVKVCNSPFTLIHILLCQKCAAVSILMLTIWSHIHYLVKTTAEI